MVRRIEQVNDLIREELGKIIDRDVDFPAALVTITRVVTSSDLHYADVFLSILPVTQEGAATELLESHIGSVQRSLNRKLRMRPVPRIKFLIDKEQKRADRIEKLLAQDRLKRSKG